MLKVTEIQKPALFLFFRVPGRKNRAPGRTAPAPAAGPVHLPVRISPAWAHRTLSPMALTRSAKSFLAFLTRSRSCSSPPRTDGRRGLEKARTASTAPVPPPGHGLLYLISLLQQTTEDRTVFFQQLGGVLEGVEHAFQSGRGKTQAAARALQETSARVGAVPAAGPRPLPRPAPASHPGRGWLRRRGHFVEPGAQFRQAAHPRALRERRTAEPQTAACLTHRRFPGALFHSRILEQRIFSSHRPAKSRATRRTKRSSGATRSMQKACTV